jgi:nitrate reductase delta subunit
MIVALNVERLLPAPQRAKVCALVAEIAERDLLDAQADYVELFDRTRALSLHLFEHVHGESRDRGQAMVSLRERYRAAGFDIASNELPDYLPLFVEFLATRSAREAQAMLAEPLHILAALAQRLRKRGSRYADAFEALGCLASRRPADAAVDEILKADVDDPNDLASLDRSWEEAEVRFGPSDAAGGGCPKSRQPARKPVAAAQTSGLETGADA